jgi:hypothetical protein
MTDPVADFLLKNPWTFALFFVMAWTVALSLIARLSGWSALAERYEAVDPFEGPTRRFQTIAMSRFKLVPATYGNIVNIGADARGLHLSLFLPFRPFHPRLVVPWSDLHAAPKQFLLWARAELTAAGAPEIKIAIPGPAAAWLAERSGGRFVFEAAAPQ